MSLRCPKCGAEIELFNPAPGQIVACSSCGIQLQILEVPQQMKDLLSEIKQVFPDKIIDMSGWDHDRWDDLAAYFCAKQGFGDITTFLQSYGFQVLLDGQEKPKSRKKNSARTVSLTLIVILMCLSLTVVAVICLFGTGSNVTPNSEKYSQTFSSFPNTIFSLLS